MSEPIDIAHREAGFDALYRSRRDPWGFETSAYEHRKYDATLAATGERRFEHTLEVGCSIGVLSERLAAISQRLTALDVSSVALETARKRVPEATFLHTEVPAGWPGGRYDLIVFSEVLYFLQPAEVEAVARLAMRDLRTDGRIVLVNWLGECDMTLDGQEAADLFVRSAGRPATTSGTTDYRIDVIRP